MVERACKSVGIDLGTTYSAMAYIGPRLIPQMLINSSGKSIVPSVVYFDDEEIIVGDTALENAELHADRVAQFIKVHMGDKWRKEFQGHEYTPESLSAIILGYLVREAEPQIGPVNSAVITVPAYFTEKRRRATQHAGEIAGLEVIGTLNEPMAATLAYGLHRQEKEQIVVVYDLGGGTFDVTVVRIAPGEIEELATNGNRQLGGKDWDRCLIDYIADDFLKAHGVDPLTDPQAAQDLQLKCEHAKRQLSERKKVEFRIHACGSSHSMEVTRERFEQLTSALLESTRMTMEIALRDAGQTWNQVSRVVLTGGSTLMPAVRTMIKKISGKPPDTKVHPVMAVALGAAIYAHMLDSDVAPQTIKLKDQPGSETAAEAESDAAATSAAPGQATTPTAEQSLDEGTIVRFVTAHGVGVRVRDQSGTGWKNMVLIPKNSRVPIDETVIFPTANKVTVNSVLKIPITQGDTTDVELAELLGEGHIKGFPADEPPGQPVKVTMRFDDQGRLNTEAEYVNTGQKMQMSIEVAGGLRTEEVQAQREHLERIGFLKIYAPDTEKEQTAADDSQN